MAEAVAAEVGKATVSSIASKVTEIFVDPIVRETSYVFKYQSYVRKLSNQVENLKNKSQMVEQPVKDAETQGDEIYDAVKKWVTEKNRIIELADKLINEDENKAKNKRCFGGLCPRFMARRKLSKEAVKAERVATDLLTIGNFSKVSYRPVRERTEFDYGSREYRQFDSRMKVFQDVMDELKKESQFNTIGVYGMGGVGKTTLVKRVAKKVMEDKLFDEAVMAEVTQTPDLETIRNKIAHDLDLKFDQTESVFDKADRIRRRLKKKKRVLVILDNIWEKIDLEAVGIPSGVDDSRQCTILLTSRDQHVLCNDMNSQKNFWIEVLSNAEAMSLFWATVGDHPTSDFQSLAVDIVGKCGGLPLAIKTIANALKNKPLSSEEAKLLFRLCALQKDGSQIFINDLMVYVMGLDLFTGVHTLERGRIRVDSLIHNLKTSCLLMDGETEGDVKMHDIVHAVAVSIARDELMYNIGDVADLKREPESGIQKDATAISLPYRNVPELPERLECPKLKLFLFAEYRKNLQIPDHFFQGAQQLRVLELRGIHSSSLPYSLDCLIHLRSLSLINCRSLGDVAIVGQLKKLEILCFRGSFVKQLPGEIGQLTQLKLLDLRKCRELEVIAPNVISNLSQLEELYTGDSFTRWEKGKGGSNASIVELKALSKLRILDIHIQNVQIMPHDLVSVELEGFKILIGDAWEWRRERSSRTRRYNEYESSRTLKLSGLDKSLYLGNGMKNLLRRTEYLHLDKLNGLQNVNELENRDGFPLLKLLHVKNNSEVLYIVNSVGLACNALPVLESLFLSNLVNLKNICPGQLIECPSFSKLRIIDVEKCHKLKHLFSFSMAQNCVRLEEVQVTDCKNINFIVGEERESHIVFSQLHSLVLKDLPQLITTSASKEIIAEDDLEESTKVLINHKICFPNMEKLELASLNIKRIWLDQFPTMQISSCQNLTKLIVKKCNCLKFLLPYSVVNSLARLQHLAIKSCDSLEGVIETTRLGRDEEHMIESVAFPKLYHLELSSLPKLTGFMPMSSSVSEENSILHSENDTQPLFNEKIGLPSLKQLEIKDVDNLRNIWHHQLHSDSFSKLKGLSVMRCHKLTNIFPVNVIEGRRFDGLETLRIHYCNSIEEIVVEEETSSSNPNSSRQFHVFPRLTKLSLSQLPELKSIYQGIHILELSALKDFKVLSCNKVEILFGSSESKLLSQEPESQQPLILVDHHKVRFCSLEELEIREMENLRKIWQQQLDADSFQNLTHLVVAIEEIIEETSFIANCMVEEQEMDASRFHVFPQLTTMFLVGLRKLKSIYQGIHILEWLTLKHFVVTDCGQIELLFGSSELLSRETTSQQPVFLVDHHKVKFPNLRTLRISSCKELRNLAKLSAAEGLVNLTNMNIDNCKKMENIIGLQVGEEVGEDLVVFSQLEYLGLNRLHRLESFCLGNYTLEFPCLAQVFVRECPSMKIFSQGVVRTPMLHGVTSMRNELCWEGNLNSTAHKLFEEMVGFRGASSLRLSEIPKLKEIWHDQILPVSFFGNLYRLEVDDCAFMSSAIPANLLPFLKELMTLEVKNCNLVEEVVHLEELNADVNNVLLFPKLKTLYLRDLPKLERFCNFNGDIIEFPELDTLSIYNCPNMKIFISNSTQIEITANKEPQEMSLEEINILADAQSFFDEKVVFPRLQMLELSKLPQLMYLSKNFSAFKNLSTLQISKCDDLVNVVTLSSTAESLVNLRFMMISDCKMLEEIIELQIGEVKKDPTVFCYLECLILDHLPSLASFCSGSCTLEFPNLNKVIVRECPKMKIFSQGVSSTPQLQRLRLQLTESEEEWYGESEEEGCWEGDLNSTIQKLFEEMSSKDENIS
ncbi:Disease resistance protein [Melia azedarach]|uniref:Disease resistance protein n=1 Tax=Melia azedarach TaxID=155640 RepID=A0ACC1YB97_MELAZ|nr:Disease resistance protein [Melia azedarach]